MSNNKQLKMNPPSKAICLRLSQEEYNSLKEISTERGENIQSTLRSAIFNKDNLKPVMEKESANKLVTELKRIGNNINQIAKHLNSGLINGWGDEFDSCSSDISKIRQLLTAHVAS